MPLFRTQFLLMALLGFMLQGCAVKSSSNPIVSPIDDDHPLPVVFAENLDSLQLIFLSGLVGEDRMPIILPPPEGDRIACEIKLVALNVSTTLYIDSVKAQTAEVFLKRTRQKIGTLTFWPDGSKILAPDETDTIAVYQNTDTPYPFEGTTFQPEDSVSLHVRFADSLDNTKVLITPYMPYEISY